MCFGIKWPMKYYFQLCMQRFQPKLLILIRETENFSTSTYYHCIYLDSCKLGRLKHFVGPYAERLFMVVKILRLPSRICNIFRFGAWKTWHGFRDGSTISHLEGQNSRLAFWTWFLVQKKNTLEINPFNDYGFF